MGRRGVMTYVLDTFPSRAILGVSTEEAQRRHSEASPAISRLEKGCEVVRGCHNGSSKEEFGDGCDVVVDNIVS
jgi:hypothetical protein